MPVSSPSRYPIPGTTLSLMPRPRGGRWLVDELTALRREGVTVLVSLLTLDEARELDLTGEATAAHRAGLRFHAHPITDLGVPDRDALAPLLDTLAADLRTGNLVAVHCRAGIGRSSLVAAALLVRLGHPVDKVWHLIGEARGCPVPETDAQRGWLTGGSPGYGSPG